MESVATDLLPLTEAVTLQSWSAEWLRFSVHLKPKTLIGYESLLRTRILPTFGGHELDAIDEDDLMELVLEHGAEVNAIGPRGREQPVDTP